MSGRNRRRPALRPQDQRKTRTRVCFRQGMPIELQPYELWRGDPLEVGTDEEAEKLTSQNEKDSANEEDVLSAPPKLVYNNFVLRLSRELLVAVASGWDKHVDIIDKIIPQAWKDEPVARILELCILHIAMAEMTSKGTPHKIVINEKKRE